MLKALSVSPRVTREVNLGFLGHAAGTVHPVGSHKKIDAHALLVLTPLLLRL